LTDLDATIVTQGTTAPTKVIVVAGKTNDATAQYREVPEGAGGRSVIVEGIAGGTTIPVSGTVTSNQGSAPWTQRIQDGVGATLATVTAGNALKVDGSAVTQPVSGTVTTTPPSNASSNVAQFGGTNIVTGTGVSGSGIPRVTVSNDSTVGLVAGTAVIGHVIVDSGAVTNTPPANQSMNLAQVGGTGVTLGAKTSAASIPVVLATDEAALPVTGTFFQGTQPVSAASLPLPTGAATSANQATEIASLALLTPPASSTMTRVQPAWRQNVILLAANAARKEGQILNNTDAPFFLKEGNGASDIAYSIIVPPRARYLFDVAVEIDGFWNQLPTRGEVIVTERM
jgi:hypothetical protein